MKRGARLVRGIYIRLLINYKQFTTKPAGKYYKAYLRDLPDAESHLLDTGHFALEDDHREIAGYITKFLQKV